MMSGRRTRINAPCSTTAFVAISSPCGAAKQGPRSYGFCESHTCAASLIIDFSTVIEWCDHSVPPLIFCSNFRLACLLRLLRGRSIMHWFHPDLCYSLRYSLFHLVFIHGVIPFGPYLASPSPPLISENYQKMSTCLASPYSKAVLISHQHSYPSHSQP